MMRPSLVVAVALALAALYGCAGSPKSDFYTLSPAAAQTDMPPAAPIAVLITVVTVPDLVDRPQIVVRSGDNKVDIDEFARWADPLKSQIPRVIRADLGQLLNSPLVSTYAVGGDPASAYRVQLDIQRFDAALGEAVTVDVLWSVAGAKRPKHGPRALHKWRLRWRGRRLQQGARNGEPRYCQRDPPGVALKGGQR
jgi:uncharacterized lipoprotein YmbA